MAAQAWELYNIAKKYIGNGTIKLGVDTFRMQLHKSTSNASTLTISVASELTNEVNTGGYTAGGIALSGVTWSTYPSAKSFRLDSTDVVFSATGTVMSGVQFAVVRNTGATLQLLMKSKLSTAAFDVAAGNSLTVQIHTDGYFTLV